MNPSSTPHGPAARNPDWWRGAVLYQVYPRSFQDSNGDGIGDLAGVVQRLPHLVELGVEALWLSPFFKSPMKDFGYDIADYKDVDPIFGSLADFDTLVQAAHAQGLKVLIDQVMSHCSDQHPWFVESRASRDNPRADWFVWADPKADGTPPNNWQSIFGGSAWQWDTRRRQYYLHNFLTSQPDLNFHNPLVQEAALDAVRFWLERGVDGFRFDVICFCFHDALLRDNPPRTQAAYDPAVNTVTPYAWQLHQYDKSQPENLAFLRRLRQLLDAYPDIGTVGEVTDDDALVRIAEYTGGGDKLHMAYSFDLLGPRCDAPFFHGVIDRFETPVVDGWACWAVSNHDVHRVATRWQVGGGAALNAAWQRLVFALQACLRGSLCIYQGDELGLPEVDVPFEQLQDPYGITMWPEYRGRDGCRTPMPWDAALPHAGFSNGAAPWLPVAAEHLPLAAGQADADPASLLHFYRATLAWRRAHPVLRDGALDLLPAHASVLAFVRHGGSQPGAAPVLCVFNLGSAAVDYSLPAALANGRVHGWQVTGDIAAPATQAARHGQSFTLPPYSAAFASLQHQH
ncbi:MAG: malL [Rhodoferax sp.]|nr:malL [Rhodoferax sp.]